jgi:hypothetical protein
MMIVVETGMKIVVVGVEKNWKMYEGGFRETAMESQTLQTIAIARSPRNFSLLATHCLSTWTVRRLLILNFVPAPSAVVPRVPIKKYA